MATKKAEKTNPFKSWNLQDFQNSIAEYKEKYCRRMLIDFYTHWSETDEKGVMKFQLGKTWSTAGRLVTWRSKNYGHYERDEQQQANNQTIGNSNVPSKDSKRNHADLARDRNGESRAILGLQQIEY